MFGGVPIIGGIESALMGQNNYRARAPSTAAGNEAIKQQMALAGRRAASAQHSAMASARGPTAGLMAREGMRRGAMAQQSAMEQTGILQKQLEQNALDQQMRAQEINARIAGENAGGIQRLAGAALGGLAVVSDERTKNVIGDKYAGATGGPDDGRRVIWGQQSPMAMERDKVAADAKAAGVQLSPSDYAAMGYAPPGGQADVVAPRPAPVAAPAQPAIAQPSFAQRLFSGMSQGFQLSDKRAKDLADENRALRETVLRLGGVEVTSPTMRKARPGQVGPTAGEYAYRVQSDGKRAKVTREAAAPPMTPAELAVANRMAAGQPAPPTAGQIAAPHPAVLPPRPVNPLAQLATAIRSDEDCKDGKGSVDLEFPEGVEPKAFTYKPEFSDGDPGVHYGVMAQDLEKSKEGATVVEEDPATGMKQVDPGRLTMLNTASLADIEQRLRRLEGRG